MSRVSKSAGALYGVHTANKRYRCDGHLTAQRHNIEVGQQYVASALPPHDNDIGNERWWHARFCVDCAPEGMIGQGGTSTTGQNRPVLVLAGWDAGAA